MEEPGSLHRLDHVMQGSSVGPEPQCLPQLMASQEMCVLGEGSALRALLYRPTVQWGHMVTQQGTEVLRTALHVTLGEFVCQDKIPLVIEVDCSMNVFSFT